MPETIEYADYHELKKRGIKRTLDLGINTWEFRECIIECVDGTQWDYIPEDECYQLRTEKFNIHVH